MEKGPDVEIQSILNDVSNLVTPELNTLAIIMLARVIARTPSAEDGLEALKWVPVFRLSPVPILAHQSKELIRKFEKDMSGTTKRFESSWTTFTPQCSSFLFIMPCSHFYKIDTAHKLILPHVQGFHNLTIRPTTDFILCVCLITPACSLRPLCMRI